MKNIIYFISILTFVSIWMSCDTFPDWEKDLQYSDAYPIAGEWYVTDYDENGDILADGGDEYPPYILYIYNKAYNPTQDSIWIDNRTGHPSGGSGDNYEFRFKIKCKADKDNFTFDCTEQGDVTATNINPTSNSNIISITNSKVFINSSGIEDATADSIVFDIEVKDSNGLLIGLFRTAGHRKTGWEEPNYDDDM